MELIPIIYTVLEIVVALTIIALAVSYIGSKMRQKRDLNVTGTNHNADLLAPIVIDKPPKPAPIKQNNDRQYSPPKEAKLVSKLKHQEDGLKPIGISKENSIKEREKKISPLKDSHKDSPKRKAEQHTPKPKIQNERLSILTNLSSEIEEDEKPKTAKVKKRSDQVRTLGDDILGKYMEDNENDMFTLKVTKKGKQEDKS